MTLVDYATPAPPEPLAHWPRRLLMVWGACVALRTYGGSVLTATTGHLAWWDQGLTFPILLTLSGVLASVMLVALLLPWQRRSTRWVVGTLATATALTLLDQRSLWYVAQSAFHGQPVLRTLGDWLSFAAEMDWPLTWWCAPACAVGAIFGGRRGAWISLITVTLSWAALQLTWPAYFSIRPSSFWRWDLVGVRSWIRVAGPPLLIAFVIWRRPGLVMLVVALLTISVVLHQGRRGYQTGIFYYDFTRNDLPMLGYLTFPLAWWFAYRHLRRKLGEPAAMTPEEKAL